MKTIIRNTLPHDFQSIVHLTRRVYPGSPPWRLDQLMSHLAIFPEGQFVAVAETGKVVGMAASLIVRWDDYNLDDDWRDFTDAGMFTNHDSDFGRTLYGAEIMVDPETQRSGVGGRLYAARRKLAERFNLLRIRAAARLRGYHRYAQTLTPHEYVWRVMQGQVKDPTLSFQLKHGFQVIGVVNNYLQNDYESGGHAALIEWRNRAAAPVDREMARHTLQSGHGGDGGESAHWGTGDPDGVEPDSFEPGILPLGPHETVSDVHRRAIAEGA